MDKVLGMLGLAKKAGRLEVGEEPVDACVHAGRARLVIVAGDADEARARHGKSLDELFREVFRCF